MSLWARSWSRQVCEGSDRTEGARSRGEAEPRAEDVFTWMVFHEELVIRDSALSGSEHVCVCGRGVVDISGLKELTEHLGSFLNAEFAFRELPFGLESRYHVPPTFSVNILLGSRGKKDFCARLGLKVVMVIPPTRRGKPTAHRMRDAFCRVRRGYNDSWRLLSKIPLITRRQPVGNISEMDI